MDGDEDYVGQLREVFDDCDSSGQGQLGRDDLVRLCEKLQVDDQSDALVGESAQLLRLLRQLGSGWVKQRLSNKHSGT